MSIRKMSAFLFFFTALLASISGAEEFGAGQWNTSNDRPIYFTGESTFTITWTEPTYNVAYLDYYRVYHSAPGSNNTIVYTNSYSNLSRSFSGLGQGLHRFIIECLCYESETQTSPNLIRAYVNVEVGVLGEITPDYKVLSILYSPPGRESGGGNSSVTYSNGSSLGSMTSASSSFIKGYEVAASGDAKILGNGGSWSINASGSTNNSSEDTLKINKEVSTRIVINGPSVNGIDHNRDQIILWLRPKLRFAGSQTYGEWKVNPNQTMTLVSVFVGHLRNPSAMPSGTKQLLVSAGITPDHYEDILSVYPFAIEGAALDTNRFKSLSTTFFFTPPYGPNDPTNTQSFTASFSTSTVNTSSVKADYSVKSSLTGSASFLGLANAKWNLTNKWSWTDIDTRSDTNGTSETISVTIGGPTYGYTGPTTIGVYYDVIYKTFAFVPISSVSSQGLQGSLDGDFNGDISFKEVVLVANGETYRTFTNEKGEYHFPYDFSNVKDVSLKIDGITKHATIQNKNTLIQID